MQKLIIKIGESVSWLNLLLTLIVFVIVVCRYAFGLSWVWLQELSIYIHALIFMSAAAYTLQADQHVKVDVLSYKLSEKMNSGLKKIGVVLFLWPTCVLIFYQSWSYVVNSWHVLETSTDPNGLPGIFLLKTLLLVYPSLLFMQGLLILLKKEPISD